MSRSRTPAEWAAAIAEAYAAEAKPPLTDGLLAQVRSAIEEALGRRANAGAVRDQIDLANEALEAFEIALRSVAGPRVDRLDEEAGVAVMKHRSEADRPLRAFGGQ